MEIIINKNKLLANTIYHNIVTNETQTCSSTMLFVISYGIYPIFIQNMNIKLKISVCLIMAPTQKLALALGATIRDNNGYLKNKPKTRINVTIADASIIDHSADHR